MRYYFLILLSTFSTAQGCEDIPAEKLDADLGQEAVVLDSETTANDTVASAEWYERNHTTLEYHYTD